MKTEERRLNNNVPAMVAAGMSNIRGRAPFNISFSFGSLPTPRPTWAISRYSSQVEILFFVTKVVREKVSGRNLRDSQPARNPTRNEATIFRLPAKGERKNRLNDDSPEVSVEGWQEGEERAIDGEAKETGEES